MHLRHLIAGAAVASSSALASPTTQVRDDKPSFGVAFTYANGTFTDVFPIPDSLEVYALDSRDPVVAVFFQTATLGVFGRCTLLERDRQGLGVLEFNKPTTRAVNPPAVVGFVQCNSE